MSPHDRNPRAGGRWKIDWNAAFAAFLADPTIGLGDIARRFGVSEAAVRKHAKPGADHPEGWEERRRQHLAQVATRLEQRAVRTAEERAVRAAILHDRATDRLEKLADPEGQVELDPSFVLSLWKETDRVLRLYAGEATDRVAIADVRPVIVTVVQVAGRFVPRELRDDFLRALEEATASLPALGQGDEAA